MEKFIIKINVFCIVILFFALNNFSYSQIIHQIDLSQQILTTNTIIGDDGNNYTGISLSGLTFF